MGKQLHMGYATDDEEHISGVRAIAAPIKPYGAYLSAIWVVGFKASMTRKKLEAFVEQIKTAVEKINQKLSAQS